MIKNTQRLTTKATTGFTPMVARRNFGITNIIQQEQVGFRTSLVLASLVTAYAAKQVQECCPVKGSQ